MSKFSKRIKYDARAFLQSMLWEFKYIIKDSAVFTSFIGVAILVSFLYTYIYANETLPALNVGAVDLDNSTYSRQFLRMASSSGDIQVQGHYTDLEEAKKAFTNQTMHGIIIIPREFSRDLQKGNQPVVSIYADASYILYYKQIVTATQIAATYMGAGITLKKNMAEGKLATEAMSQTRPVSGTVVSLYNPSSGYGTFLVPIVLVIIFQTTILTAIGILGGTMREGGKFTKLYPNANYFLGTLPIVMGKATTYLIISLTILMIMLGIVMPTFHIPMRNGILPVIIFMIPFFLSIVYLGIFLLSYFKRREDAILFIMFTSIPTLMVTGYSWPLKAMPDWINIISYLFPSTLGSRGFVAMTQMGASLQTIQHIWVEMWALCLFYLILATLAMKKIYLNERK
ncbi:ABC transporter permease [Flavobacteriaceae bacterium Ap0902]|nr:ABC transporter permease [Flavobacteriaceae bacterium Ap0902]